MSVKKILENRVSASSFLSKEVKDRQVVTILNAGCLAPNAIGLEAWNFYVITDDKSKLQKAFNRHELINQSAFCVIITAPTIECFKQERVIYQKRLAKKGIELEKATFYIDVIIKQKNVNYLREQTIFAANSMILQAEELGIQSTILGGYNTTDIASVIGVDESRHQICSVIAFGYADNLSSNSRNIRDFKEVVAYVD